MDRFVGFIRDRSGASSADYVIILAGLCAALVIAGLFLDNDTQMRLQAHLLGLVGGN